MTCSRSHREFVAEPRLELASLAPRLSAGSFTLLSEEACQSQGGALRVSKKSLPSLPDTLLVMEGRGLRAGLVEVGGERRRQLPPTLSLLRGAPLVSLQICLLEGGQSWASFLLFTQGEHSSFWSLFFS